MTISTWAVAGGSGSDTVFRKPPTREKYREISGNGPLTRYRTDQPATRGHAVLMSQRLLQDGETAVGFPLSARFFRRPVPVSGPLAVGGNCLSEGVLHAGL
jgi:hypothetical protein